jgi:FKBP-type peptidyl-prolyl cis-trans isomerase
MRRGETAKLYIPAEMAYGWQGVDGLIKPDTDLVIKVTLKKIVSV